MYTRDEAEAAIMRVREQSPNPEYASADLLIEQLRALAEISRQLEILVLEVRLIFQKSSPE